MTSELRAPPRGSIGGALVLGLFAAFLGYTSGLPPAVGIGAAVALVALGTGLRSIPSRRALALAPVPPLAGVVLGALWSPLGLVPELAAGAAGLAYLVWLADDPSRPPGGIARARMTLLVPAVALGLAWSSALLLPSSSATLGIAAVLLVLALGALAYLIGQPTLFDLEPPASS